MAIYQTIITERAQVAEKTLEVSFERPGNFHFKAGQYIQLGVPKLLYPDNKGASRVLSIATSPLDDSNIAVAFRDTGSGFKRTLKEVSMGSQITIEGPHGFFTLPENPHRPIVFIAGGIGITPYLSMVRFAVDSKYGFPVTLLYSNRSKESAPYLKELQNISSGSEFFTLKSRFGKIDERFIRENVNNIIDSVWYVSGPPAMVDFVRNTLFLLGVDGGKVFFEEFAGYG